MCTSKEDLTLYTIHRNSKYVWILPIMGTAPEIIWKRCGSIVPNVWCVYLEQMEIVPSPVGTRWEKPAVAWQI